MEGLARIFTNCACCGVRFEMYHHGDYWCDRCAINIPDSDEDESGGNATHELLAAP